jgi:hypothetical protein
MNLWTNTDQYDQSTTGATEVGHDFKATSTRYTTRRLTDRAMLALVRSWLLQDYAAPYCHMLGTTRIFRRCYWIDALGNYDARSLHIPSASKQTASRSNKQHSQKSPPTQPPALQPIITLSQTLAQESQPTAFHGLLLVAESGHKRQSKNQGTDTKAISMPKGSGIISANGSDIAPMLLKEIEQAPAIFVLDPLNPQPFSIEDLTLLYQRTIPTELCFIMSHKLIELRLKTASTSPEQATLLTAFLRSNRWKALPLTGDEAINGFLDLFIASMQRYFQWLPQRIHLPVQNGAASITNIPYTLVYATRRADSLLIMNDAICDYRRRTYQQSYRGVLSEEWFVQQEQLQQEKDLQQLRQRIQQQGTALRARRWPELRQQIMLGDFGHFMRQEYDASLQQLIAQQHVHCVWRQMQNNPENLIMPENDDILIWH